MSGVSECLGEKAWTKKRKTFCSAGGLCRDSPEMSSGGGGAEGGAAGKKKSSSIYCFFYGTRYIQDIVKNLDWHHRTSLRAALRCYGRVFVGPTYLPALRPCKVYSMHVELPVKELEALLQRLKLEKQLTAVPSGDKSRARGDKMVRRRSPLPAFVELLSLLLLLLLLFLFLFLLFLLFLFLFLFLFNIAGFVCSWPLLFIFGFVIGRLFYSNVDDFCERCNRSFIRLLRRWTRSARR